MRYLLWLIAFVLVMSTVTGATVHGSVYDFSLQKMDNVKVEINTKPVQRDITENGKYSFQVEPGKYVLRAEQIESGMLTAVAAEEVEVTKEGKFVVDIILFPELDESVVLPEESTLDLGLNEVELSFWWFLFSVLIMLGCIYYVCRRSMKEVKGETDADEVLAFIKKVGGRTTQKDIRKQFPHSEAKMSLLLTELEASGKVKKLKKGRGNVIVLQRT